MDDDRVDKEVLAELDLMSDVEEGEVPPLLDLFINETIKRLERLAVAVAEGDADEAGRVADSMKGSAGAFGARRLSALAAEAEVAGRDGKVEVVGSLLPIMRSEFEAFRSIVFSMLGLSGGGAIAG